MKDAALLPLQLEGLDASGRRPRPSCACPAAGHFAPWEAGDQVAAALAPFLADEAAATASSAMTAPVPVRVPLLASPPSRRFTSTRWKGRRCRVCLKEFHDHRLGATIEDQTYHDAERDFFDDLVSGADARRAEIDTLIAQRLAKGWTL